VVCAHAPAHALEQVLAIRAHLDDSHEKNGPLRVLPGTHRRGVLSDDAIHDLAIQMRSFTCCASADGVLAMKPLLVHASSKAEVMQILGGFFTLNTHQRWSYKTGFG
jgi:hypothetical protein